MSWRVLIVFLVLAGVASWQGGVQLGNWLVTRAPDTVASVADKDYKTLKLDALGRPITAQPPQPRIDGTLGVPRELTPIEWAIEAITADVFEIDPNSMKVEGDDDEEGNGTESSETADAKRLAQDNTQPTDRPDVAANQSGSAQRPAAPPVPPGITVTVSSWQQSLKQELEQCAKVGFFQRPTCLQNARNKYCAPNDAWGRTQDCPARQSEQLYGN
ncbi:MAG: hypothetical protein ACOYMH_05385 [Zwartia sp.]|jgi:hypothetical protein